MFFVISVRVTVQVLENPTIRTKSEFMAALLLLGTIGQWYCFHRYIDRCICKLLAHHCFIQHKIIVSRYFCKGDGKVC